MANTKQGIYYPDNYNSVADVPADMKKMAESIDTELETDRGRLSTTEINIQSLQSDNTTNKQDISDIKKEQATQNTNITKNASDIKEIQDKNKAQDKEIANIKSKNTVSLMSGAVPTIDWENKTITFNSEMRLINGTKIYTIPKGTIIDINISGSGWGEIYFNTQTSIFKTYDYTNVSGVSENEILIALFNLGQKTINSIFRLQLDKNVIADNSINSQMRTVLGQKGYLNPPFWFKTGTSPKLYINLDTVNKKLQIPKDYGITWDKYHYDIKENIELDLSSFGTSNINVWFDTINKNFVATSYFDRNISEDNVYVCSIRIVGERFDTDQTESFDYISNLGIDYTIDGFSCNRDIVELQNNVSLLKDSFEIISEKCLPNYAEEKVNEMANTIQSHNKPKNLSIAFMTDLHINTTSDEIYKGVLNGEKALKTLCDVAPINLTIFGGDYIQNNTNTTKSEAINYINTMLEYSNYRCPSIYMRGNHDSNNMTEDTTQVLSENELYCLLAKRNEYNDKIVYDNYKNYGYIDFDKQNIRVIFMNSTDVESAKSAYRISTQQYNWLVNTLKTDKNIIIFTHVPFVDNELWGNYYNYYSAIHETLKAFKNKKSWSGNLWLEGNVSCDFSTIGTTNLIAVVCGHTHRDAHQITDDILYISSANAGYLTNNENEDGTTYTKEIGTITETAFDVITIDLEDRKLYINRYGVGKDREYSF